MNKKDIINKLNIELYAWQATYEILENEAKYSPAIKITANYAKGHVEAFKRALKILEQR